MAWFPNEPKNVPDIHLDMHQALKDQGVPWRGSKFKGSLDDFFAQAKEAKIN